MAEPSEQPAAKRPRKPHAIPEARDRLQSRSITSVVTFAIVASIVFGALATGDLGGRYKVAGVSLLFAAIAGGMHSATLGGAIVGALTCFCMTWWTRDLESPLLASALPPLLLLFLLTFAATRGGRKQKLARGLAEPTGGRRAAQVAANLGVAALVVTPLGAYVAALTGFALPVDARILSTACLAALAEATADTVSSEIGQAFGRRTYLLTTLRRVHRGTDGGVSLRGTLAGIVAATLVVLVGAWSLHLTAPLQFVALLAGLLGLFADSLLGATFERRGWIGNDLVNLSSTAIAALLALLLARLTSVFG